MIDPTRNLRFLRFQAFSYCSSYKKQTSKVQHFLTILYLLQTHVFASDHEVIPVKRQEKSFLWLPKQM